MGEECGWPENQFTYYSKIMVKMMKNQLNYKQNICIIKKITNLLFPETTQTSWTVFAMYFFMQTQLPRTSSVQFPEHIFF